MVFWQVTVGRTVSGADRFKPCSLRFHHLTDGDKSEGLKTSTRGADFHKKRKHFHYTHHGFFTMRSSSLRKPFWTIHLSLRNLDLEEKRTPNK